MMKKNVIAQLRSTLKELQNKKNYHWSSLLKVRPFIIPILCHYLYQSPPARQTTYVLPQNCALKGMQVITHKALRESTNLIADGAKAHLGCEFLGFAGTGGCERCFDESMLKGLNG